MVMVTWQVPPAVSEQVLTPPLNVMLPVPPFCEKVMTSPVTVPVYPVSVAVHTELAATLKLVGLQETVTVSEPIVRVRVPRLAALLESTG
jgi:hypothetical protein